MTQLAAAILPTDTPSIPCRACKQSVPQPFFDMGLQPLANGFLDSPDDPEERFPLVLCRCDKCGMVQLGHVVPKEKLYEDYSFRTSSSTAMVEHFRDLIITSYKPLLGCDAPIIEIASNDGSVLCEYVNYQRFQDFDPQVMGIEPARNLCTLSAIRGVATIPEYFSERLAQVIACNWHGHLSPLIVACNVLGHVDDLDDFLRGVKTLLHPDGRFVFEVPYLVRLLERGEFDTIYHEHLNYYSITAICALLDRHGFRLENVQEFDVHGGTIRCTVLHGNGITSKFSATTATGPRDTTESARTNQALVRSLFDEFLGRTQTASHCLKEKLISLRKSGKRIIAYGASAKGTIVLNYCDLGADLVEYVIDTTPEKQGKFMPGTHQPIVAPEWAMPVPDVILLLAWNHRAECEAKIRACGFTGEIILPHEVQ